MRFYQYMRVASVIFARTKSFITTVNATTPFTALRL